MVPVAFVGGYVVALGLVVDLSRHFEAFRPIIYGVPEVEIRGVESRCESQLAFPAVRRKLMERWIPTRHGDMCFEMDIA